MSEVRDLFFPGRPLGDQKPDMHQQMERAVHQLQGQFPDVSGFIVFVVDPEGSWSTRHATTDGILGRRMLVGLAVEGIRENILVDNEVRAILRGDV